MPPQLLVEPGLLATAIVIHLIAEALHLCKPLVPARPNVSDRSSDGG